MSGLEIRRVVTCVAGTVDLTMLHREAKVRRIVDFKTRVEHTASGRRKPTIARFSDLVQVAIYSVLAREALEGVRDRESLVVCLPRTGGAATVTGWSTREAGYADYLAITAIRLAHAEAQAARTKIAAPVAQLEDVDPPDFDDPDFMEV